jgi:hypothetical protein
MSEKKFVITKTLTGKIIDINHIVRPGKEWVIEELLLEVNGQDKTGREGASVIAFHAFSSNDNAYWKNLLGKVYQMWKDKYVEKLEVVFGLESKESLNKDNSYYNDFKLCGVSVVDKNGNIRDLKSVAADYDSKNGSYDDIKDEFGSGDEADQLPF